MKTVHYLFFIAVIFTCFGFLYQDQINQKKQCGAILGYEKITKESDLNEQPLKQVIVNCPKGKKAIGAGWSVLDKTNAILDGTATYFEPSYDAASWMVNAKNNSTFEKKWKLRVVCFCANVCDKIE